MKEHTLNSYQKSINLAVDYINRHLSDPMDLKKIAGETHLSEYHFHRIFKAYIGESVGSYISRLRLEKSAQRLQVTQQSLNEIAENTGYQNQHTLSRAFKKHFGVSPKAFRNLQTYFTSTFRKPEIKTKALNPEIRELKEKQLLYTRIIARYGSPDDYRKAWKKLYQYAQKKGLLNSQSEYIGLSFDDPNITQADRCRFYACITVDEKINSEGEFGIQKIDNGRFAVFTHQGSYAGLNSLYQSIYLEWLSNSNVKLRDSMPFEKYLNNPDQVKENEILTEIYIPIL